MSSTTTMPKTAMGVHAVTASTTRLLVFEINPLDPLTFLGMPLVLGVAALLAAYVPEPPRQPGQSRRRALDRRSAGTSRVSRRERRLTRQAQAASPHFASNR